MYLLAPFDPVVWDRRRFELFWGWAYRFEAYTPVEKRKLGYYALPVLFRDSIVGWANVSLRDGQLDCQLGFPRDRPRGAAFDRELEAELERMREFLLPASARATTPPLSAAAPRRSRSAAGSRISPNANPARRSRR